MRRTSTGIRKTIESLLLAGALLLAELGLSPISAKADATGAIQISYGTDSYLHEEYVDTLEEAIAKVNANYATWAAARTSETDDTVRIWVQQDMTCETEATVNITCEADLAIHLRSYTYTGDIRFTGVTDGHNLIIDGGTVAGDILVGDGGELNMDDMSVQGDIIVGAGCMLTMGIEGLMTISGALTLGIGSTALYKGEIASSVEAAEGASVYKGKIMSAGGTAFYTATACAEGDMAGLELKSYSAGTTLLGTDKLAALGTTGNGIYAQDAVIKSMLEEYLAAHGLTDTMNDMVYYVDSTTGKLYCMQMSGVYLVSAMDTGAQTVAEYLDSAAASTSFYVIDPKPMTVPTVDSKTSSSVKLNVTAGMEYYLTTASTYDWSDTTGAGYYCPTVDGSYAFSGLACETTYYVYYRLKGGDATDANQAGSFTVKTADHELTLVPAKAATYVTDGNSAYYVCGKCNKYYSDAAATTEIEEDSWVIKKVDSLPASEQPVVSTAVDDSVAAIKEELKTLSYNGSQGADTVAGSESIRSVLGTGYIDVVLTDVADVTVSDDASTCQILTYVFEVTPRDASGAAIANSAITQAMTFRLPVPAEQAALYAYANVYHKDTFIGQVKVNAAGYIETSSDSFSPFSYTLTNVVNKTYFPDEDGDGSGTSNKAGGSGTSSGEKAGSTSTASSSTTSASTSTASASTNSTSAGESNEAPALGDVRYGWMLCLMAVGAVLIGWGKRREKRIEE